MSIAACVAAGHRRVDAHEHALARGAPEALEPVDVVGVVDDDHADAGGERVADVAVALGVAVQQDVRGIEAGGERDRQLAGGGDVAAEPLLGQDPRHRRARQRLGREVHVGLGVAARRTPSRYSRAVVAQALLVDHERGRAELGREVGERAAADGQAALGVGVGGPGEHVEERPTMAPSIRAARASRQWEDCPDVSLAAVFLYEVDNDGRDAFEAVDGPGGRFESG